MQISNKKGLPEPLVAAIKNDPYKGGGDISPSRLVAPIQQVILSSRYYNQIEEDAADKIWPLVGNNTHEILERVNLFNCLREVRLAVNVNGWLVTGQFDLFELETKTLSDYKVTSTYAVMNGIKPEYEIQLNIYAYMLRRQGIDVKKLAIVNILRDWSKFGMMQDKDYPRSQVHVQRPRIWGYREIYDWIYDRVLVHQEFQGEEDHLLPKCTNEEKWHRNDVYAVKKEGRKKAVRLLKSQKEALVYMADKELNSKHYIELRKGEDTRCEYYCSVKDFCHQYKMEKKQ